ncbi:hypothetical protein AB6905_16940, partial [Carnobacterium maltaromaticum]|uniref:hypothetical protein n=1 Tax=Carnobacterium maltaromaticum TaxID=2751 RepID=UPI0039BE4734
GSRKGFKSFLHHINKDKSFTSHILKIKSAKTAAKNAIKRSNFNNYECLFKYSGFIFNSAPLGKFYAYWRISYSMA